MNGNNGPLYLAIVVALVLMGIVFFSARQFDLKALGSLSFLDFLQRIRKNVQAFNQGKDTTAVVQDMEQIRKEAETLAPEVRTKVQSVIDDVKQVFTGTFSALGSALTKIKTFASGAPAPVQAEAQMQAEALTAAARTLQERAMRGLKL